MERNMSEEIQNSLDLDEYKERLDDLRGYL